MVHALSISTALEQYFMENLGIRVTLRSWTDAGRIPLFLRDAYEFFECPLLGTPWLVMCDRGVEARSPTAVEKHMGMLREKWHGEIMYVHSSLSTYTRKRLVEQKVPFVIPGKQMYLPQLGVELREHVRNLRKPDPRPLSPSAQVVFLSALYFPDRRFTPSAFAERLGYSYMTLSRAFDELEAVEAIVVVPSGRERQAELAGDRRSVWERALPFLRSPVRRRSYVRFHGARPPGPLAGLSALSHYSMLAPPDPDVYAVSGKTWKNSVESGSIQVTPIPESASLTLEVWRYEPSLLTAHDTADPLSVYLSLKDSDDERIVAALEEMLENAVW